MIYTQKDIELDSDTLFANDEDEDYQKLIQDVKIDHIYTYSSDNSTLRLEDTHCKVLEVGGKFNEIIIDEKSTIEILKVNGDLKDTTFISRNKVKILIYNGLIHYQAIAESYYNVKSNEYHNIMPLFYGDYHIYPELTYAYTFANQFVKVTDIPNLNNIIGSLVSL